MNKIFKDFRKFFQSKSPFQVSSLDDRYYKNLTPYITKEADRNMVQQDIYSHLLQNRIIFFGEEFNSDSCNIAMAQLLWLNQQDPKADISIYINSPGGSVTDCFGLLSTIDAIENDVSTIATGLAASCANLLLVSGTPGKRKAVKLAKLLAHQPMGGIKSGSQASDIVIEANFISELKEDIAQIYMNATGLNHDSVWQAMDRDNWVRPENALPGKLWGPKGMIDEIVYKLG